MLRFVVLVLVLIFYSVYVLVFHISSLHFKSASVYHEIHWRISHAQKRRNVANLVVTNTTNSWKDTQTTTVLPEVSHPIVTTNNEALFVGEYGLLINAVPSSILFDVHSSLKPSSSHVILSKRIPNEDPWYTKAFTYERDSWEQPFLELLKRVRELYYQSESNRNVSNSQFKKSKYTTAVIRYVNKTDSPFMDSHNICMHRSFMWDAYFESGYIQYHYPHDQSFRWTHKLHMFKKQLPEKANWVEDGYYFVVQPCTMRHIGHFAEAINHLLIKLRYPSLYPPFTDMYIPMFVNELEWSETYMKLLLSLFPENLKPAVHLGYSISTSPIACFRSAVLLDRVRFHMDGSLFAGFFPLDLMKATAWRYANVQSRHNKPPQLQLLLVNRKKTRSLIKRGAWRDIIASHFKEVTVTYKLMEGLTFLDQLQLYYNADIVVSPHSASFINLIFSVPHTAIVECYPKYFFENWYSNTAMISRVHYIMVGYFDRNPKAKMYWKEAEDAYNQGTFLSISRKYVDNDVDPPQIQMLSAIEDAVEYAKRWRFLYEVNDKWSPIFI